MYGYVLVKNNYNCTNDENELTLNAGNKQLLLNLKLFSGVAFQMEPCSYYVFTSTTPVAKPEKRQGRRQQPMQMQPTVRHFSPSLPPLLLFLCLKKPAAIVSPVALFKFLTLLCTCLLTRAMPNKLPSIFASSIGPSLGSCTTDYFQIWTFLFGYPTF